MNENGCACPELKDLWKRFTEEPKARISKHMLKHLLLPSVLVDRPRGGSGDPETVCYLKEMVLHIANDAVDISLSVREQERLQAASAAFAAFESELRHPQTSTTDEDIDSTTNPS